MPRTREERLEAARVALEGLSIGDAAGRQRYPDTSPPPWLYSDDTVMGLAILEVLTAHRSIEQDVLAATFARRFAADPERGYGAMAYWQFHAGPPRSSTPCWSTRPTGRRAPGSCRPHRSTPATPGRLRRPG